MNAETAVNRPMRRRPRSNMAGWSVRPAAFCDSPSQWEAPPTGGLGGWMGEQAAAKLCEFFAFGFWNFRVMEV
jgi:hypothetical protein